MIFLYILFSIFIAFPAAIKAQAAIDTNQIRQWIDTARERNFDDPDYALICARKALSASRGTYYYGVLNALQLCGEVFYIKGIIDSALFYYHSALQISVKRQDVQEQGHNCTGLATIFLDSGDRDSCLYYYRLAIAAFNVIADSTGLCDVLLRYGNAYNALGNHNLAIEAYMQSLNICEAIGSDEYVAYNYGSIGIVHDKQGNYSKAEQYFMLGLEKFRELKDVYGQMGACNNLGILYKNMRSYERSLEAYTQCLMLADSIDFDRGRLSAHTNLGILNILTGHFENAMNHSSIGLALSRQFQARESIADNLNSIARAQNGLGDHDNALRNASEALQLGIEVQSLEKQRDANLTLAEISQDMGAYARGLEYYKAYSIIKDSLFNTERTARIAELQTIYETEKKDKEIRLLEKSAEIDQIRKTRLWVGLGLTLVAGGLLVYGQWVRRTRDKKILAKEKDLEVQRRKTTELEIEKVSRELDFKKQELVAKALQLARKNEFLQSLNTEVNKMREDIDGPAADSARRIARQIRTDIESEEDWELFLSSFREVHRDFLIQLQQTYPDITKGEIRLACLMKMNLSAKEMAALLNVTPDGIKKARYRLRKKMNLDSDVDIQQYLLSYPG
jgi:tetratricopeptide (TPR) repeat protein